MAASDTKGVYRGLRFYKTLLVVCASSAAICAEIPLTTALAHPTGAQYSVHGGFTFAPGGCELGQADCDLRKAKQWAADEIDVVKEAIDDIATAPYGKAILNRCQQRGFRTLRRYAFGGTRDSQGAVVPLPGPEAQLHRDRFVTTIDINDPFFLKRGFRDTAGSSPGYRLVAQVLLHECLHAVDDLSGSSEFLAVVGFTKGGTRWRFAVETAADASVLTQFSDQFAKLGRSGDWERIWRINRSLALQMRPVRVPTMGSIRSPAEAFAEIGSHLVLDGRARGYLLPAVVTFFEKHVFIE